MDKNFENWKQEYSSFCKVSNEYEIQILYTAQAVQYEIELLIEQLESGDKAYTEININKIINNLSSIRAHIRHSKA